MRACSKPRGRKAGWGRRCRRAGARGVALAESFGSYVAQVAEVSLEDGRVKVHKVVCAVDCGIAINPDVVMAQMQGGIGFGLGAILKGAITLDGGKVVETNFDTYDVAADGRDAGGRGPHRPVQRAADRRRRARRAADRPGRGQCGGSIDRQAGAHPAAEPERPQQRLTANRSGFFDGGHAAGLLSLDP